MFIINFHAWLLFSPSRGLQSFCKFVDQLWLPLTYRQSLLRELCASEQTFVLETTDLIMNIIKSKCKTNYSHPLFPNLKLIYSDPIDIVKSASFWLFNSQDPIINSLFNRTHKKSYIRIWLSCIRAYEIFLRS